MVWPKQLINCIARNRSVLFLGAGISMNSTDDHGTHPKDWKNFLTYGLSRITNNNKRTIKKEIEKQNYLLACELLKKSLGDNEFIELLKDEFERPHFHEAEIHKDIFKLNQRIVITPNFDKIYDSYATHESNGTIHIKKYDEEADIADGLRRHDMLIIKMHGTIDAPQKVIFTQKDYAIARTNNSKFYKIIEALLMTHTFIFIGAGINDPDIRLLLENYSTMFHTAMPHFFITTKDNIITVP